jgi:hypothetical protein
MHVDAEVEAILHSKIELKCIVDAVPPPRIVWFRLNADNVETESVLIQTPGDQKLGTLERNITIEDEGKWRCIASNTFRGKTLDFIVTVIGT